MGDYLYNEQEIAYKFSSKLHSKYKEYVDKDGDPDNLIDFWGWLIGAYHVCEPPYGPDENGVWEIR